MKQRTIKVGQMGRRFNRQESAALARNMAVLRPELSYDKIANRFGVSREGVRVILKSHGYHEILKIPHKLIRVQKLCPQCDKDFGALISVKLAKTQKFCGNDCKLLWQNTHLTDRQKFVLTIALKLRISGRTWPEIATKIGYENYTGLPGHVKKYAAKENVNVSSAFGFIGT